MYETIEMYSLKEFEHVLWAYLFPQGKWPNAGKKNRGLNKKNLGESLF
jgi:hypothetical protein